MRGLCPSKAIAMKVVVLSTLFGLILASLLAVAGCESGPETPPMDQPIDRDTAMEIDARLRQDADDFLKESQEPQK